MLKWFACLNEEIKGPFSNDEMSQRIDSGEISDEWLVWGKPLNEWKTVSWWVAALPSIIEQHKSKRNEDVWHYVINEVSHGPMSREQLIHEVSNIDAKSDVFIWTKGMKTWAPLFECPDLVDEIGISRRKHPRANIDGQAVIKIGDHENIGKLVSVSAGGCAVRGFQFLTPGQTVSLSMRSEHFRNPINAKVEVRYISENGLIGLKFVSISMEEKAAVIDYVREKILVEEGNQKAA